MAKHEPSRPSPPRYSPEEEFANRLSHGLGALLALAGLPVLVVFSCLQGDPWRIVSSSIYGATLLILFLGSTIYHSVNDPRIRGFFRSIDHVGIYLLIAGSYTPFTLVSLRASWGWTLFGLVWALACAGVVLTFFFPGRPRALAAGIYVAMGWMVIVAIVPLARALHGGGTALLAVGGTAYTLGAVLYVLRKIPFNHAIFHLFVLGGSICHYFAILFFVVLANPQV